MALISQMHSNERESKHVQNKSSLDTTGNIFTFFSFIFKVSNLYCKQRGAHTRLPPATKKSPPLQAWISILSQRICSSGHIVWLALAVQINMGKESPEIGNSRFIFQTISVVSLNKYCLWNVKALSPLWFSIVIMFLLFAQLDHFAFSSVYTEYRRWF